MPSILQFSDVDAVVGTTNIPITTPLVTGDLLLLVATSGQGGGKTIALSGFGTWTLFNNALSINGDLASPRTSVYSLTGVTGTGNVTITVTGTPFRATLYVIRGLNSPIIYSVFSSQAAGTVGTQFPVGLPVTLTSNQVAVSIETTSASGTLSLGSSSTPSASAWTVDSVTTGVWINFAAHVIGSSGTTTPYQPYVVRTGGSGFQMFGVTFVLGEPEANSAVIQSDYVEALTVGSPQAAIDAQYVEALTVATPQLALDSQYVEVLTPGADGAVHLFSEYVEVLSYVPSQTAFIGWGIPRI